MRLFYKSWDYEYSGYDLEDEMKWEEHSFFTILLHWYYIRNSTSWFMWNVDCNYDGVPYKWFQIGALVITFGRSGGWIDLYDKEQPLKSEREYRKALMELALKKTVTAPDEEWVLTLSHLISEVVALRSTRTYAEGFKDGEEAVQRENRSGCCCLIANDDIILEPCALHNEAIKELEALREVVKADEGIEALWNTMSTKESIHDFKIKAQGLSEQKKEALKRLQEVRGE